MPNSTWDGGSHHLVVNVEGEWAYVEVDDGADLDAGWANRVLGLYGFELMEPDETSPEFDFVKGTVRYWAARIDGGSDD